MSKPARPTLDSLSDRFARKSPPPGAAANPEALAAPEAATDAPAAAAGPGRPPKPKADARVQILTRIDPATRRRLKVIAAEQERTIQEICEEAIRDFVARHSR